jgi:hypothetical protein
MVITIDKKTTDQDLLKRLEQIRNSRAKRKKPNLVSFFGALPNIGDGLEFQKKARNEWD